jgi:thiamine-phosphate diphosphorylase
VSAPARLLWIVDGGALDRGVVPDTLGRGVTWLQLRDPSVATQTWSSHLAAWSVVAPELHVVVNAGPDWAQAAGYGAHLKCSQENLGRELRARWPLLGRSVHDPAEARRALLDRPDYLIAGPIYPTSSKPGHPGIGIDGLKAIVATAGSCAVLAVGGVTPERVSAICCAGAFGVAVRSGIGNASDPAAAVREYLAVLPANAD